MTEQSSNKRAATRLLILGATGKTGRHLVEQAVTRGDDVTVLVRSAAKAAIPAGVRVVVGDATDEAVLRDAVRGQDAVVSALGTPASPFREVTTLSTATTALVAAMKAEGVARLVAITGIGAGDSVGHGGFVFDTIVFPLLLRHVYADKNRQEAIIRASGLEWIVVRPVMLNDGPARSATQALTDLRDVHGGSIARADVAAFTLEQVVSDAWLRRAPLIR